MSTINVYIISQRFISPTIVSLIGILYKKSKKPVLIRLASKESREGIDIHQLRKMFKHQATELENKLACFHVIGKAIGNTVFVDTNETRSIEEIKLSLEEVLLEAVQSTEHKLLQESFNENLQDTKFSAVLTIAHHIRPSFPYFEYNKVNFRIQNDHWVNKVKIIDDTYTDINNLENIEKAVLLIEAPLTPVQFSSKNKAERYRFISKLFPISYKTKNDT
jgi:hypothetical protein